MLWTQTAPDQWCAEASQFGSERPVCPKCNKNLLSIQGKEKRDGEGELTHTEFKHPCGAKLTIFND